MQFETVYQELQSSTAILRSLLDGLASEDTRLRPDPDSWSILEVVCHLYDEDREDFRTRLDLFLNHPEQGLQPIDPQSWVKSRKYNEQDFEEMRGKFFAQRAEFLAWLKGLESCDWDTRYISQKYGEFVAGDMLCAWAAHDNLHIRQLVELRRMLIEKMAGPYSVAYAGDW